ncbi:MAG: hypothetical protein RLZZ50_1601 [Verrucomicrobiota bacterium]|jgi:hypothetical protein
MNSAPNQAQPKTVQPSAAVSWLRAARALRAIGGVIKGGYGHWRSACMHRPVDARGEPLPWFTYPAIEFLGQFDLGAKRVFEFGAGNSTLYWGARCAEVVSVESDPGWHSHLDSRRGPNVRLQLETDPARYVSALGREGEPFDIIVVDGLERLACSRAAPGMLRPGGLVVLDNADWHPGSAAALRAAGLLQVDMTGFGPVNGYSWTTSLFFHRDFDFSARGGVRPQPGIGSIRRVVD